MIINSKHLDLLESHIRALDFLLKEVPPNDSWSSYTDLSRLHWLDWHDRQVAIFPRTDEADACEFMGRTEKAALIRKTIKTHSRF